MQNSYEKMFSFLICNFFSSKTTFFDYGVKQFVDTPFDSHCKLSVFSNELFFPTHFFLKLIEEMRVVEGEIK